MALPTSFPMPMPLPNVISNIMDVDIIDKDGECILKARSKDGGLEPPTKKLKTMHTKVEMVLRQTTEIIMVLVGVASLRGGAPPNPLECHLATKLYEKMTTLVTILAPQDLLPNDVLQSLIQQLVVPPLHPTHLDAAKISSIQPQSSKVLSTISTSKPSLVPSSTVISKAATRASILSPPPSPLTLSAIPISLPIDSTPLVSIPSSSQILELQAPAFTTKTTSTIVARTSKVAPPISKIAASIPSTLLEKTKELENMQTSNTNLEKSVSPSIAPLSLSNTNTNIIVETSITPTNTLKLKFGGRISPVKCQALPGLNAQDTTTMTTIFINDQPRSQAPKVMAKEQGLKILVSNEPPSIILDSQQTHKQLALVVHLLLKPHITSVGLEKLALKYINIPIPCGICKIVVNTTINVLVCDGCECVFHLQCLQLSSTQSIFKNDWYCPKCVIVNVGRTQAPKYGPLRRGPIGAGPKNSWSMEV